MGLCGRGPWWRCRSWRVLPNLYVFSRSMFPHLHQNLESWDMSWQFSSLKYVLRLDTTSRIGKNTDGEIVIQCTKLKFGYLHFPKLQNIFQDQKSSKSLSSCLIARALALGKDHWLRNLCRSWRHKKQSGSVKRQTALLKVGTLPLPES